MKSLIFTCISLLVVSSANASNRVLLCNVGGRGAAKIEVLRIEGETKLQIYKFQMKIRLARSSHLNQQGELVRVAGFLTAQIYGNDIIASGRVENDRNAPALINPQLITLQGEAKKNGELHFMLYDQDRVFQLGYGVGMGCK